MNDPTRYDKQTLVNRADNLHVARNRMLLDMLSTRLRMGGYVIEVTD